MRWTLTARTTLATVFLLTMTLVGCSQVNGKEDPKSFSVRDSDEVGRETEKKSSEILEILNLKGKVTEPGAGSVSCSDSSAENTYRARHPWSIYDVPVEEMKKAMDRLRKDLPEKGWKIVKDGHDDSQAQSPQIIANSSKGRFSVDIRLQDRRTRSDDPSIIEVTVVSGCYRYK